jgi:vacuolar-type H+-ATPase subunit F/Vma7
MARVAAIGEGMRVAGYALGGAVVLTAETDEEVRAAWDSLPADVAVVILTTRAARAVGPGCRGSVEPLAVVLPS